MPKKASKQALDSGFKGFFNYTLTDQDKSAIKALEAGFNDKFVMFYDLCGAGYKITISAGGVDSSWFASATGKWERNPNRQRCLTARHHDPSVAVAILHHIIFTVYDEGAWPEQQEDTWDW